MPVIQIEFPDTADEQVALFVEVFGTEPGCSFAAQNWDYPYPNNDYVPHLICDTHHDPADPSVYIFDPGAERGLCNIQQRRLLDIVIDRVYAERQREMIAARKDGATTETRA